MNTHTLVVDERELSTIRAALLLLQEHVDMLPEDLAEILQGHGHPVTTAEIDLLSRRLDGADGEIGSLPNRMSPNAESSLRLTG